MAINLFSKTMAAHSARATGDGLPSFLVCEQDPRRSDAFMRDLREKGGSELAQRVETVGSGRE